MNGVLIIDKPVGLTSFDVVRRVRSLCHIRRVGHAGTLDPLATGVLPVAVGSATRLIEYMMAGDKVYQATMRLGVTTDTQDSEGRVIEEKSWQHVDRAALDMAVASFVGETSQMPPMYSALKKDGKPLYQLARQGIEVERQPRLINIESFVINACSLPLVTFTVHCSKGTYVRTLCHDLGEKLNCGAHMTALRRLSCGRFNISDSHSLEELLEASKQGRPLPMLSPAEVLGDWPAVPVDGAVLCRLRDGVAPDMSDLDVSGLAADDRVCFVADGVLVALASFAPGGHGKRPGDFEILKVFPMVENDV